MKKIAIVVSLFTGLGLAAAAQQQFPQSDSTISFHHHFHRGDFQHQRQEMMQALNLTPDQQAKLKTLNQDFHQQMQELNDNENNTVKAQRDSMYTLRKQHKEAFMALLT